MAESGDSTYTRDGGTAEDDQTYPVSTGGATVTLAWDMREVPDRLELVLPSPNLPGIPISETVYFATGLVQHTGTATVNVPAGYSSFKIIVNRGGGLADTLWSYALDVEDGDSTDLSGIHGAPNQTKDDPASHPDTQVQEPIDISSGAHLITRHLLSLGGARPLTFDIDYDSLLSYNGPLGTGWSHNHQTQLQSLSNGQILLRWTNKRQNAFHATSTGANTFVSNDQRVLFYTLVRNADGSFNLRYKDQSVWAFDSLGRMLSQTNAIGQKIVYTYNGMGIVPVTITEPISGHSFSLAYDNQNKLTQVDDNTGRTVFFTYSDDETDRLIGITLAEGNVSQTYTYTYDGNGRVLTGTTPEGVTVFQDSYDDAQRVESQTDTLGNTSYFAYDEASQPGKIVTTVTDRLGKNTIYVSDANYHLLSRTDPLNHTTSYAYDANGSRASVTDANGHKAQFAYDAAENLTTTTDAAGNVSTTTYSPNNQPATITNFGGQQASISYDGANRPATSKDFQGNQTGFAYDANSLLLTETLPCGGKRQFTYAAGQPTQITNPTGNTTNIGYDAKGRPITITDAAGGKTVLSYDINDHVVSRTDPLGNTASATFDSRGLMLTQTDPCGCTTKFTYDGNKNLLFRQDALGNYTSYGYDAEDRMYGVRDANGHTAYFSYDDAGRLNATTDPLGNTTHFALDAVGNRIGVTDALGNQVAATAFDERNLPLIVQDALGHQTKNVYDPVGRLTSRTDPLGRTTIYGYDANSRLASATNPLSQVTAQSFDADGNLSALTDAKKHGTGLSYDLAGRLAQLTTPTGAKTTYAYDPRGLVALVTEPSGQQSKSGYDATGRESTLADGTGTTTYTYDANGRVLTTTRTGDPKPIMRTYDALGRLTKFTDYVGDEISYTYDAVGNQTQVIYASGITVTYTYDAANRMTSVTDWNKHQTTYAYDADGHLTKTTRPDGSVETRSYDVAGQLTGIEDVAASGKIIYRTVRSFDDAGQVTSEDSKPKAKAPALELTAMTYDADNRLATFNGAATSFDADGNMVSGPLLGNTATVFTYDSRNLLESAGGLYYFRDAEGYRTGVAESGKALGHIYDRSLPLSRLIAKGELDGSLTRYVYGLGLISDDRGGSFRLYHFDARGSTVALTDSTGAVIGKAQYGPFGEIIKRSKTAADTPFLFNGRYGVVTDDNGLYYMRARYYDPTIRRFINQDPTFGSPGDGSGLNRFAFVDGNPVSFIDPFGLSKDEDRNVGTFDFNSVPNLFGPSDSFTEKYIIPTLEFTNDYIIPGLQIIDGLSVIIQGPAVIPEEAGLAAERVAIGAQIRELENAAAAETRLGLDDLSNAAAEADRGGLTVAGRSLTKHGAGARSGNSLFPAAEGNPGAINQQAQNIVDDILTAPGSATTNGYRGRFGNTIEVTSPDGRGIVYDANGNFLFFKE